MSGLSELKASLASFLRGELTAERLEGRVADLLYRFPGDGDGFASLISQSQPAGLPQDLHLRLIDLVASATQDGAALKQASGMDTPVQLAAQTRDRGPRLATPRPFHEDEDPDRAEAAHKPGDAAPPPTDHPVDLSEEITELPSYMAADSATGGEMPDPDGPTLIADSRRLDDDDARTLAAAAQAAGIDFDPFSADPDAQSTEGRDGQETAGWDTPTRWSGVPDPAPPTKEIGPGYVLKDRFELLTALGEGGMGVVYKAIDRLKVEARDRNPFLAVKLLSGDFRSHPEAFIALQREASKAQRLGHPNIATVYDFDRDGDTIYMTMELLEGEPLNAYIKRLPAGGLPVEKAMDLIGQLAAGLSYAHKNNLVHSDLKPGNCFLTRDGTLKLLDFGIARASQAKFDSEGETTIFDPAELGALTPAYATLEMFDGHIPDPRDDIYALACISYELLAGKHPYGKVAAPRALTKKLVPAPVAKISRHQFKGLVHALAFKRDDRTPTVDQFLEEIRPKAALTKQIAFASVAGILLAVALAYQPVQNYFRGKRDAEVAATLTRGAEADVLAMLPTVDALEPDSRRTVLEQSRDRVIDVFENRIERVVDGSEGRYDYPAAMEEIEHAKRYFPDSARLLRIEADIRGRRNRLLNELNNHFNKYLSERRLLPVKGEADVTDVMQIVAQADPDHPLLADPRLPVRYAQEAERALNEDNLDGANAFIQASANYGLNDSRLRTLAFKVKRELRRREENALVAEIHQQLESERADLKGLADFERLREELVTLARLRPESPILADVRGDLKIAFDEEFAEAIAGEEWVQGERLLQDFAKLLDIPHLTDRRSRLSSAETSAGYVAPGAKERAADIEVRQAALTGLLSRPEFTQKWENSLLLQFKDLIAMVPPGDEWLNRAREQIARLYTGEARNLRAVNRFDEALAYLEQAEHVYPGFGDFAAEKRATTAARKAFDEQQAERARMAEVKGQQQTLLTQANANKIKDAGRTLAELRKVLPVNDPFLVKEGPEAIGNAYLRVAEGQAAGGRYESALRLTRAGLAVAPDLAPLQEAHRRYGREVQVVRMKRMAGTADTLNVDQLRAELAQVRGAFPNRYPAIVADLSRTLEQRVRKLAETDLSAAHSLLAAARELFPDDRGLAAVEVRLPPKQAAQSKRAPSGGRPCRPELAGYGARARATCYDTLADRQRGPLMVVVPPSELGSRPFAISKYEVSIRDFNLYCKLSGTCAPIAAADLELPVTGISAGQAQAYAEWLSEQAGRSYRLPREEEWVHAATADGTPTKADFNCRVQLGSQLLKGHALVGVRSGKPNGWGLTNHVGNAQEWVITESGLAARGGDYRDNLSQCAPSLSRAHDGEPDPATGFRVVLEMG